MYNVLLLCGVMAAGRLCWQSMLAVFLLQTAEAFSAVLRSNSTLREVDLSSNALGVAGGRMLREAMAENMYACTLLLLLAASLNMCVAFLIVCMCTPGA